MPPWPPYSPPPAPFAAGVGGIGAIGIYAATGMLGAALLLMGRMLAKVAREAGYNPM